MINKTLYRKQRLSNENLLKTGNELRYSGRGVVPAPLIYETVWTFICIKYIQFGLVLGRVFNATFNNITVISWRSALLVEETEVPEENHRPAAKLYRVVHLGMSEIRIHNFSGDI